MPTALVPPVLVGLSNLPQCAATQRALQLRPRWTNRRIIRLRRDATPPTCHEQESHRDCVLGYRTNGHDRRDESGGKDF